MRRQVLYGIHFLEKAVFGPPTFRVSSDRWSGLSDHCDICCALGSLLVQFCGVIWVLLVLDCLASKPPRD